MFWRRFDNSLKAVIADIAWLKHIPSLTSYSRQHILYTASISSKRFMYHIYTNNVFIYSCIKRLKTTLVTVQLFAHEYDL